MHNHTDTIAAISTPSGIGGIAVIRVSGPEAIDIVNKAWKGKPLTEALSHTAHLGRYISTDGDILDECVATIFRNPKTFTGEDVVEISVHGSKWIQRELMADLIRRGARTAQPGEFTQRAFLNGRLDLAQAEGIADLIAASSQAAHAMAITQTRGRFSKELDNLREQLIEFASLLELELDFSEEDVEFADRSKLLTLSKEILDRIDRLTASYSAGAVLKEGVPVAIAGVPNAGKSSLLNLLLNEEKAIVTDIPGTTRDTIEDTIEIDGILYRFIDTAGLRESTDIVETIGIERARAAIRQARIIIWLLDTTSPLTPQLHPLTQLLPTHLSNLTQLSPAQLANLTQLSPAHLANLTQLSPTQLANLTQLSPAHTSTPNADPSPNLSSNPSSNPSNPFSNSSSHDSNYSDNSSSHDSNYSDNSSDKSLIILLNKIDLPSSSFNKNNLLSSSAIESEKKQSAHSHPNSQLISSPSQPITSPGQTPPPGAQPISSDTKPSLTDTQTISSDAKPILTDTQTIPFSTKTGEGLSQLTEELGKIAKSGYNPATELMVTNARHYEALLRGKESLTRAIEGIQTGLSADFIAQDVREALHHLGTITGSITSATLLHSIFSRFCIGK